MEIISVSEQNSEIPAFKDLVVEVHNRGQIRISEMLFYEKADELARIISDAWEKSGTDLSNRKSENETPE